MPETTCTKLLSAQCLGYEGQGNEGSPQERSAQATSAGSPQPVFQLAVSDTGLTATVRPAFTISVGTLVPRSFSLGAGREIADDG
jgi:hypothetical protein